MAEQYIIGNNAQFNDSVEILKDLTLYGVVENTTDFAVKIQGDEKLRITSEGALIGDTISHIGDIDTKIRFPENDVISFETAGSEGLRIESTGRAKFKGGEGQISAIRVESVEGGMALGIGNFRGVTGTGDTTRLGVGKDNNILIFTNASGSQVDAFAIGNTDPIPLVFSTSNTERLRITSSGILVKGHTESAGQIETQLNSQNQFHGNDRRGGIRIGDFSDSQFPASLQFVKSRNTTIGQNTILQDGDHMGSIYWGGANGTNYQPGAFLTAKTDGTVSSTAMPTALSFGTNEGNSLLERLRIDPDGRVTLFGIDAQDIVHFSTGNTAGNTFANIRGDNEAGIRIRGGGSYDGGTIELAGGLRNTDPGIIKFSTGTGSSVNERMRIDNNGKIFVGVTPQGRLCRMHISGDNFPNAAAGGSQVPLIVSNQDADYGLQIGAFSSGKGFLQATRNDGTATVYDIQLNPSGGNVEISDGNLILASGHGIDFSATANSTASGATMGNELLNDYEKGTFTPVMYGHLVGTGSNTVTGEGNYIKVGQTCTISFRFVNKNGTALPSAGGNQMRIAGLPFAFANGPGNQTSAVPFTYNVDFNTSHMYTFIGANNNSYLRGYYSRDSATWQPWMAASWRVSQFYLYCNMTYLTV